MLELERRLRPYQSKRQKTIKKGRPALRYLCRCSECHKFFWRRGEEAENKDVRCGLCKIPWLLRFKYKEMGLAKNGGKNGKGK